MQWITWITGFVIIVSKIKGIIACPTGFTLTDGVCFKDIGGNVYVSDHADFDREIIVHLVSGKDYVLPGIPAEFGYFFEQDLNFTGSVIWSGPDHLCGTPYNAEQFSGNIVLAKRTFNGCGFEEKAVIASTHGALGLVILNDDSVSVPSLLGIPCFTSADVRKTGYAVVMTVDTVSSNFIELNFASIQDITIRRKGSKVGDACFNNNNCVSHPSIYKCDKNNLDQCICEGNMYIPTTVNGIPTCKIASNADPHTAIRGGTCGGYIDTGAIGCGGVYICRDYPAVACMNEKCGYFTAPPAIVETTVRITSSPVFSTSLELSTSPERKSTESNVMTTESNVMTTKYNEKSTESNVMTTKYSERTTEINAMTTESNVMTTESNVMTTEFNVITTEFSEMTTESNEMTTESSAGPTEPSVSYPVAVENDMWKCNTSLTILGSCVNAERIVGSAVGFDVKERRLLSSCLVACVDSALCCGFHYQLHSGSCVTYTVGESMQPLKHVDGWTLYT